MTREPLKPRCRSIRWTLLIAALAAFAGGFVVRGLVVDRHQPAAPADSGAAAQVWTCSMHPQIQQPKPGQCPICLMDLIPVGADASDATAGPRQIAFSEAALALMELRTAPVERKFVENRLRLTGKIAYDETRLETISAWAGGRIERLFVDVEGTRVIGGDHMFSLYSPDLIAAQAEFLQALKAGGAGGADGADGADWMGRSAQSTLAAAREKLRLLGLNDAQIETLRSTNQASDIVTLNAPRDGIVIRRHVTEGSYVRTGQAVYTLADLSRLWVTLDAYESDLLWLRYGQPVTLTTEAYPGQTFEGRISLIAPTVDPATRTVMLRANIANDDGRLKPEMFVRAVVRSTVAAGGQVVDPDLAGHWICPMHPSQTQDVPGPCAICGMDRVKAGDLGYRAMSETAEAPLVIPASAPLITGTDAVVYVRLDEADKPTFEGRIVVLGPRAGDYFLVSSGLSEGERVVVNGSFKIDSALQIQAKPSMMSPPDKASDAPDTAPGEQTHCPVMGGAINKDLFIEYDGRKVYFCCPGCETEFLKDPDKYLEQLPQFQSPPTERIDP